MKKKLLSLALVLAMALTLLPTMAFAEDPSEPEENQAQSGGTETGSGTTTPTTPGTGTEGGETGPTTPGEGGETPDPKPENPENPGDGDENEDGNKASIEVTWADGILSWTYTPASAQEQVNAANFKITVNGTVQTITVTAGTGDDAGKYTAPLAQTDEDQTVVIAYGSDPETTSSPFTLAHKENKPDPTPTTGKCTLKYVVDSFTLDEQTSYVALKWEVTVPQGASAPAADDYTIIVKKDQEQLTENAFDSAPSVTVEGDICTLSMTFKALETGSYAIIITAENAEPQLQHIFSYPLSSDHNPDFIHWDYDATAQNAVWMCAATNPKFTITLDGVSVSSKDVKVNPNANGTPVYVYKVEQTGNEQILVVVCNGDTENGIKIIIPAANLEEVVGAIEAAVETVDSDTSAEAVKAIIANATGSNEEDPMENVSTNTFTDSAIVGALEAINEKRNVTVTVTGDESGSVSDAMKQWIAANADAGTKVAITQKSTANPKTADIPEAYRKNKITTISVEVKFNGVKQTEFGMTFPVVLPLPSGFSANPANLRVIHYHGSDVLEVRPPVKDGGSLVVFVNKLSDFAIVDTSSDSSSSGSSSGSSVSGALSGVSKPAAKPSTPAAPAAPSAPASIFTDVPAAHTFAGQIKWALDNGVMSGYADGSFRPDNNTNRQQLWMVLGRLAGAKPADMAAAREWAVSAGISDGSSAEGAMSRQQLVTMLYRFAQSQGKAVTGAADLSAYSDSAAVASYAKEALAWAVGSGIVTGTSDGRLNPEGTASRAHFAAFLYRFSNAA